MKSGPGEGYVSLLNEGPQTIKELPVSSFSAKQRQDGVQKFCPSSRGSGDSLASGMNLENIYYIRGKHPPISVIEKWLEVNEHKLSVSDRALHHRIASYGEEWKRASRALLDMSSYSRDPEKLSEKAKEGMTGECPMCGSVYDYTLARHLPCDDE